MNDVIVDESLDIVGKAIVKFIEDGHEDGKIITREFLNWALDLPEPDDIEDAERCRWIAMGRVEDFKERLLRDHRIALQPLRGVGYRVVPPADQSAYALSQAARGVIKSVRRASEIIQFTRIDTLNDEQKRNHYDRLNKLQAFAQFTGEKTTELELLRSGKETFSRSAQRGLQKS